MHTLTLKGVQEKDPSFYDYLQKEGQDLLDFGEDEDEFPDQNEEEAEDEEESEKRETDEPDNLGTASLSAKQLLNLEKEADSGSVKVGRQTEEHWRET